MMSEDALDYAENNGSTDGLSPSFDWFNRCGLKPGELSDVQPEVTIIVSDGTPFQRARRSFVFGCFLCAAAFAIAAAAKEPSALAVCLALLCVASLVERVG